jgi:hypothetical protein
MRYAITIVFLVLAAIPSHADDKPRRTENLVIVTLDGFRWQELFAGAEDSLINKEFGGVRDIAGLKGRYVRESPEARREALLPFFWGTIAKKGQVFGNPARKAAALSSNGLKFSYPGYNEMFCGIADPRINSNDKKDNPNLSVLEFLNAKPPFRGRVEAVCTWDVFPFIFRSSRNGLPVHAGWTPFKDHPLSERARHLNEFMEQVPRYWPDNAFDVFTIEAARFAVDLRRPRVLYVGLGETDEWGHGRRYDLYLDSARNSDRFLGELWQKLQNVPQYRDKTTLIVTTDHGRGSTRVDWTDHGKKVPGAEFVWIAVLGPDTPAMGERENVEVTQSQIAATIAKLLGGDFQVASPKSAAPLPVFETNASRH